MEQQKQTTAAALIAMQSNLTWLHGYAFGTDHRELHEVVKDMTNQFSVIRFNFESHQALGDPPEQSAGLRVVPNSSGGDSVG